MFLYLFPKMNVSFLGIIHGDTGTNRHVDTWCGNWTPQLIRGLPSDALIMEGSGLPWYPLPGTRSQGPALVGLPLSVSEVSCHKTLLSETHLCAMRIPFVNSETRTGRPLTPY